MPSSGNDFTDEGDCIETFGYGVPWQREVLLMLSSAHDNQGLYKQLFLCIYASSPNNNEDE